MGCPTQGPTGYATGESQGPGTWQAAWCSLYRSDRSLEQVNRQTQQLRSVQEYKTVWLDWHRACGDLRHHLSFFLLSDYSRVSW